MDTFHVRFSFSHKISLEICTDMSWGSTSVALDLVLQSFHVCLVIESRNLRSLSSYLLLIIKGLIISCLKHWIFKWSELTLCRSNEFSFLDQRVLITLDIVKSKILNSFLLGLQLILKYLQLNFVISDLVLFSLQVCLQSFELLHEPWLIWLKVADLFRIFFIL